MTTPSSQLFARVYDPVMRPIERTLLAEHRQYLVADIAGTVLDLGTGTGAMFPYLQAAGNDTAGLQLFGIEPDPHMRQRAVDKARDRGLDIEILDADAAQLPFEDATLDVVIASLVFCTISDFDAALNEVARVLNPGGELRFLEHIRGDGAMGALHDRVAPMWHAVAGGCHLNRQTDTRFHDSDQFEVLELTEVDNVPSVMPVIRGRLRRRA